MKVSQLRYLTAPFRKIVNARAMSRKYRVIELSNKGMRAQCAWAYLEVDIKLPLNRAVCIDGTQLLAVIDSAPASEEFEIAEDAAGQIAWKAGKLSRGKFARDEKTEVDKVTYSPRKSFSVTKGLSEVLVCGSIAAGTSALATMGLFGVQLDNRNVFTVRSSDNNTIAIASLDTQLDTSAAEQVFMSPESIVLFTSLLARQDPLAKIALLKESVTYADTATRCIINTVPDLTVDLADAGERFSQSDIMVDLPSDRVLSFCKRAQALAEEKKSTFVELSASDGRIELAFKNTDLSATSDETFPIEGLEGLPHIDPVMLQPASIATALAHTRSLVLDYLDDLAIVFVGNTPAFRYIISGRKDKE